MESREVKKLTDAVVEIRRSLDEINKTNKATTQILRKFTEGYSQNDVPPSVKKIPVTLELADSSLLAGTVVFNYKGAGVFTINLEAQDLTVSQIKHVFGDVNHVHEGMDDAIMGWDKR